MREDMESYQSKNRAEMDTPFGKLVWKPSNGDTNLVELHDSQMVLVARGKIQGTFRMRSEDLEVFVPADGFLLDIILASWVALCKRHEIDTKSVEHAADILDVIGNLAGAGN